MDELAMHPTVKPVALVADALLDVRKRGERVLIPSAPHRGGRSRWFHRVTWKRRYGELRPYFPSHLNSGILPSGAEIGPLRTASQHSSFLAHSEIILPAEVACSSSFTSLAHAWICSWKATETA